MMVAFGSPPRSHAGLANCPHMRAVPSWPMLSKESPSCLSFIEEAIGRGQKHVVLSADGANVVVRLVCRYEGASVVIFAATTCPAMRALIVAAD